jgi:hypothetical protein
MGFKQMEPRLVQYIEDALKEGHSPEAIETHLVKSGYSILSASEAVSEARRKLSRVPIRAEPEKSSDNKIKLPFSYYFLVGFIVFIFAGAKVALYFYSPVCGNGDIEYGETNETCCLDVTCKGNAPCAETSCTIMCGPCQYFEQGRCLDYECCSDSDCPDDSRCAKNSCVKLLCDQCQYAKSHRCIGYECCTDQDCTSGQACINHECT